MTTESAPNHSGYTYRYPRPAVTVDVVLFSLPADTLHVLLIRRKHAPYEGMWAFPGGFVEMDEDLQTAALRELREETNFVNDSSMYVEQLHAFGAVDRDPRQRTVSVAYLAFVPWTAMSSEDVRASDDAADAQWWSVKNLPELAFDHAHIMQAAQQRLVWPVDLRGYTFRLLPDEFTRSQFELAYESVYESRSDRPFDRQSFPSLEEDGIVVDTGKSVTTPNGPTKLYCWNPDSTHA